MGKKIFVSYKHRDNNVRPIQSVWGETTVRDYVDELEILLGSSDHLYKGERDDNDLSNFKDEAIASYLRNKIYDSSITIVLISKGMKNNLLSESDQWIPWEISYSLKEHARNGRASLTNAVLAVVLPDTLGGYDYYIKDSSCPHCNCRTLNTLFLFEILRKNMFNVKTPNYSSCSNHGDSKVYLGNSSYIYSVKWDDLILNISHYLNIALEANQAIDNFKISKQI